ncbi:MAG: hypothetical protein ABI400_11380 [Lacisediminihabitans sp.]
MARISVVSAEPGAAFVALGAVAPITVTAASAAPSDTIYSLVNQARFAAGLRGLLNNASIGSAATAWANQMGAHGEMSHNLNVAQQIPTGWTCLTSLQGRSRQSRPLSWQFWRSSLLSG